MHVVRVDTTESSVVVDSVGARLLARLCTYCGNTEAVSEANNNNTNGLALNYCKQIKRDDRRKPKHKKQKVEISDENREKRKKQKEKHERKKIIKR